MVLVSTTNGFKFELNQLNYLKHAQYSQLQLNGLKPGRKQ